MDARMEDGGGGEVRRYKDWFVGGSLGFGELMTGTWRLRRIEE